MNVSDINKIRYHCIKDFEFFCRYFFRKLNGSKFILNHHHKQLFDVVQSIERGEITRQIINMPPRYSKTEIAVKMHIAWTLAHNPKAKFIHLSYADTLALDNSEFVRNIITSAEYQMLFPYVQIDKSSSAKNKWYTTEGGGVYARSSSGQVTGFGAGVIDDSELFGGCIIIDDPIKPDDANSDTIRERINHKFNSTIRNRVNSRNTPILIIMQRVHPDDLCGNILENEPEDWSVLTMKAINDNGEALWPSKHNISELKKMKTKLGTIFKTQYQQNPEPIEGYLIPKSEIILLPKKHESDVIRRLCFIDPSEKNGDMMSAIFVQIEQFKGLFNAFVYDVVHNNRGYERNAEIIHNKATDSNVEEIIFEKNGVGLATGIALKNLNKNNDYKITPFHTTQNKEAKILNQYEFILRHFSFDGKYSEHKEYSDFIKDLTRYSSGRGVQHHKDAIDNCSNASMILKKMYKKLLFD